MWFLNYCSPFIYSGTGYQQIIRYIMHSTLLFGVLVYIFYIAKYKFTGTVIKLKNKLEQDNEQGQGLFVMRQAKSYPGFGAREHRMDQKKFKQWYLHYFGLHSVAVAGCIMYAPYYAPVVFAIIQTVSFTIATIMQSCVLKGSTRVVFNILLVLAVLMDILLLFALAMGVGASGYDKNSKTCFLHQ